MGGAVDAQGQPGHHRDAGRGQPGPQLGGEGPAGGRAPAGADDGRSGCVGRRERAPAEDDRGRVDVGGQPGRVGGVEGGGDPGVKAIQGRGQPVEVEGGGVGPPRGPQFLVAAVGRDQAPAHVVPHPGRVSAGQQAVQSAGPGPGQRDQGSGACPPVSHGTGLSAGGRRRQRAIPTNNGPEERASAQPPIRPPKPWRPSHRNE